MKHYFVNYSDAFFGAKNATWSLNLPKNEVLTEGEVIKEFYDTLGVSKNAVVHSVKIEKEKI